MASVSAATAALGTHAGHFTSWLMSISVDLGGSQKSAVGDVLRQAGRNVGAWWVGWPMSPMGSGAATPTASAWSTASTAPMANKPSMASVAPMVSEPSMSQPDVNAAVWHQFQAFALVMFAGRAATATLVGSEAAEDLDINLVARVAKAFVPSKFVDGAVETSLLSAYGLFTLPEVRLATATLAGLSLGRGRLSASDVRGILDDFLDRRDRRAARRLRPSRTYTVPLPLLPTPR